MRDAESFPGPASTAPIESVKEYVAKRAAGAGGADGGAGGEGEGEGERLLWSVAGLALQFKVSNVWVMGQTSVMMMMMSLLY